MNAQELPLQHPILIHIPREILEKEQSANRIQIKTYTKSEILHFDGDPCIDLELIIEGKVVIDRIDEVGNLMTVASFIKNDILGGNLLFSKNPYYPMTVTASQKTILLSLRKELIFELCSQFPAFLADFLALISDHATFLSDKIKHFLNRTIREVLLTYLRHEYQIQKKQTLQLRITKKALAEQMGIARTSLSRELAKMKEDGLIDYDNKTIFLLNPEPFTSSSSIKG
ncbi:MAG: Crp/Fnr family transcriptional regulator [Vallitaleaceae bacterium]|nr:Crp/Fnr family transcriptional regulator [Vallitaleaceae bacterium]